MLRLEGGAKFVGPMGDDQWCAVEPWPFDLNKFPLPGGKMPVYEFVAFAAGIF